MIITVEVPVSKEAFELAQAIHQVVIEIRKHIKNGEIETDIPGLISKLASSEMIEGVKGLDCLSEEVKENQEAFINAFATLGSALVKEFTT